MTGVRTKMPQSILSYRTNHFSDTDDRSLTALFAQ
jgi:hypothetical protein